jgi:hypothetical protein
MGMIEDFRGVLQDLVVPDLKALEQRVSSLEQSMNQHFAEMDRRFGEVDRRFTEQERAAGARHAELVSYLALEARVRKIEQDQMSVRTPRGPESAEHHTR